MEYQQIPDFSLIHERVDDIPLLIGLMEKLNLPQILDHHLGNNGNHQGLSNGWLSTVWLAYILCENDHRKSSVEQWAQKHKQTIESLVGQPIRKGEFNDDRLGIVLHRFSNKEAWNEVEADLWQASVSSYQMEVNSIRLDATTSYGYHTVREDGLMQMGYSKDHRPDLPQFKLMAAAAEPTGHLLAGDIYPGQVTDDGLYVPLVRRLKTMLNKPGILYVGDCKMAALATRAEIVSNADYYLMPLPVSGQTAKELPTWINAVVDGDQIVELVWDGDRLLAACYEFDRLLSKEIDGRRVEWKERVQVIRSKDLADQQILRLNKKLDRAQADLLALTRPGYKGRQYQQEDALRKAIEEVLQRYGLSGLLHVGLERQEQCRIRHSGPGRPRNGNPADMQCQVRYVITGVHRDEEAIEAHKYRLGWRVQVTNLDTLCLCQCVIHYRGGWCLERDFHLLKDRPLGISPVFVQRDDQIVGLTRLLTLGLRILTTIEVQVRTHLRSDGQKLAGLYEGQPSLTTDRPTATRLLKAVAREEVTLTQIRIGDQILWHITPVPALLETILGYLGLSPDLYTRLIENSS